MKNLKHVFINILIIFIFFSCEKYESSNKDVNLKGIVQKGPFQIGTNITIFELDNSLNQTGKSFNTTVFDDFGNFEIHDINISSDFIEIVADGFYFNEKFGQISDNKLVLKTVSDVSSSETVNVNVLTYIESERIKYLVQKKNFGFKDAKKQSEKELLNVFSMKSNSDLNFEYLDISSDGELNNILTAISSILLDNAVEASSLSKCLTEIGIDLKEDGILDSEILKSKLATSATLLDIGSIRKNLKSFYNDTSFYGFSKYVDYFLENTEYNSLMKVEYPAETETGKNILSYPENSKLMKDQSYSLGINFDKNQKEFQFSIAILYQESTTSISVNNNNLDGWNLNTDYGSYMPGEDKLLRGILLECNNPANASNNPLNIVFQGEGEILITLHFIANYLPNTSYYFVNRYYTL